MAERRKGRVTRRQGDKVTSNDAAKQLTQYAAVSAPQLKQQIDTLLGQNRCRIVLDLSGLEALSSVGLRVLAEARKRARDRKITDLEGGDVRLAGPSTYIKELLDLTGFTTMF